MKRRDTTLAEDMEALKHAVITAGLAILHSLGLHTRAELEKAHAQTRSAQAGKAYAEASRREAQRLLVLLSEPLKDWDLADFPTWANRHARPVPGWEPNLTREDAQHLTNVVEAYRLTASAVAPLRMGRVVDDKARRRGWDDQAITLTVHTPRDPKRLP